MAKFSKLQKARYQHEIKIPKILENLQTLKAEPSHLFGGEFLKELFPNTYKQPFLKFVKNGTTLNTNPLKVGVVFSGGQAAGGHNVIIGLFNALKKINPESRLFGFLGGPIGIVNNKSIEFHENILLFYHNQGGFDLIGSGRDKIETKDDLEAVCKTAVALKLDGLVIIGGDDSNTNAAFIADYFISKNIDTKVVGVPKTIDGDLKSEHVEVSFGFDTATKTFSEIIGNITRDSLSAKKYYFFIKIMGRSASHVTLECALQTHPNLAFIVEEVANKSYTLRDLTNQIADLICKRAQIEKNYGVILIPEGIIEFIPEFKNLITELNRLKFDDTLSRDERINFALNKLTAPSKSCFELIPEDIQLQLLLDRDPHGNVNVSKIETEKLFIHAVKKELKKRKTRGFYNGKFSAQPYFCGYEGRSCFPSNFDARYCYSFGHLAALLITLGKTGYMGVIKNLAKPVDEWAVGAVPIVSMINMEERKGKIKAVIKKSLVNINGRPFKTFASNRDDWALNDDYQYPGPIQFFGPIEITDCGPITLVLESEKFIPQV